jgi:hypothetical protein
MTGVCTPRAAAVFAELICGDEQWLRDEFDALIAANYPPGPPPPAPPRVPPLPPRHRGQAWTLVAGAGPQATSSRPGSGLRRQRSPPPARETR